MCRNEDVSFSMLCWSPLWEFMEIKKFGECEEINKDNT
ncbi:hypothetical protein EPYR_02898 [Erwinia pyrifoliae DSM 12163]|nr:hypothetical protein EPYR_02898 [Erwinia pyrifoliae DSM 12163]